MGKTKRLAPAKPGARQLASKRERPLLLWGTGKTKAQTYTLMDAEKQTGFTLVDALDGGDIVSNDGRNASSCIGCLGMMLLCAVAGFLLGGIVGDFQRPAVKAKWRSMPLPEGESPQAFIIGNDATAYLQTASETLYMHGCDVPNSGTWQSVTTNLHKQIVRAVVVHKMVTVVTHLNA